jgi:hypothetical protein
MTFLSKINRIIFKTQISFLYFDVSKRLTIISEISTDISCLAKWSVHPSLKLEQHSLTELEQSVPVVSNYSMYLALIPNTLSAGNNYIFTLSCGSLRASISVTSNTPPLFGNLTISPSSGYEINTVFNLCATGWFDVDLPLFYEFGYLSNINNLILVVTPRSLSKNTQTILPSGLNEHNKFINCSVKVYDYFSSFSIHFSKVRVLPIVTSDFSSLGIQVFSENQTFDFNKAYQQISVIGSVLNIVNCTGAPDCEKLGRNKCLSKSSTCGTCLDELIGEVGPHNSVCVNNSYFAKHFSSRRSSNFTACLSDEYCFSWQFCSKVSNRCEVRSKICPIGCLLHGNCTFRNTNNGLVVSECNQLSSDCAAVCICEVGYGGPSCSLSQQEVLQRQKVRLQLLDQLSIISKPTNVSQINSDAVVSWATGLKSLTQSPYEISQQAGRVALDVASTIFSYALQ